MAATATIRELRNNFPKIRKLVEQAGEVIVTDRGTPRYRLTRLMKTTRPARPAAKDYLARLRRHQARPLSRSAAVSLHDANRGER